jgi:hypothetical protein
MCFYVAACAAGTAIGAISWHKLSAEPIGYYCIKVEQICRVLLFEIGREEEPLSFNVFLSMRKRRKNAVYSRTKMISYCVWIDECDQSMNYSSDR